MKIEQLAILIEETGLSPEDVADHIGVSGMTVRRWQQKDPAEELGPLYEEGVRKAVFEFVMNGRLQSTSRSAQWAFGSAKSLGQKAALAALGFPTDMNESNWDSERLMVAIEKLGESEENRKFVAEGSAKLDTYSRLSGWDDVMKTVRAHTTDAVPTTARSLAFGALCYLLMPFDMIPDALPLVGLLDDFAILSFAAERYRKAATT